MEFDKVHLGHSNENSISECFNVALKTFDEITNCHQATNSSEVQYKVKKCMNLLESVTNMVSQASMFSANENISEVPTSNVKFLLLPVLLGTLALKLTSGGRLEIVKMAEIYFRDFLQRCKVYGVKEDIDIPCMEETDETGAIEEAVFSPRNIDMMAMARRRATKIQQYREQKELENQTLLLKKEYDSANTDEEIERKYFLSFVNCYINRAVEDLECLMSEKSLLMRVNKEKPFGAPVWDDEGEKMHKNIRSKPLKAILITRDEFQKKVFGYGYPSLPTVTVKELYEQRMRDGTWAPPSLDNSNLSEFSNSEIKLLGDTEEDKIAIEEAAEEDDPAYIERTRNMDEYKDTHRRGWGNRYNRS